ncbi:hypothetical protein [Sorangium sp. So ce341]
MLASIGESGVEVLEVGDDLCGLRLTDVGADETRPGLSQSSLK